MKCFFVVFCTLLFQPFVFGGDTTASKTKINKTVSDSIVPNETQMLTEGGSISPDKLIMAFPKTTHNVPGPDIEVSKSKIVARKGAFNYTDEVTKSSEKPLQPLTQSTVVKPISPVEKSSTTKEQQKVVIVTTTTNKPKVNSTSLLKSSESVSTPVPLPKKPLILNADVLENSPPAAKSSPKTLVYNQLQSPNSDVKSYLNNANSHPGMVMPIVITILLVPMFAVLGYMALRRGQEAWKNRHYKRMDFLLDGMYND